MNALLRNHFKQIWKLISVATIISELFFFALFFTYFSLGYQLVLSEPTLSTAIIELGLTISALVYFTYTSLRFQASIILKNYAWLGVAIMQYLDFAISEVDTLSVKGTESNPLIGYNVFSPINYFYKLLLVPGICLYIQFRFNQGRNVKWKAITGSSVFLFYIGVIIWNIIPLVI